LREVRIDRGLEIRSVGGLELLLDDGELGRRGAEVPTQPIGEHGFLVCALRGDLIEKTLERGSEVLERGIVVCHGPLRGCLTG
jgi:hypothetical protein